MMLHQDPYRSLLLSRTLFCQLSLDTAAAAGPWSWSCYQWVMVFKFGNSQPDSWQGPGMCSGLGSKLLINIATCPHALIIWGWPESWSGVNSDWPLPSCQVPNSTCCLCCRPRSPSQRAPSSPSDTPTYSRVTSSAGNRSPTRGSSAVAASGALTQQSLVPSPVRSPARSASRGNVFLETPWTQKLNGGTSKKFRCFKSNVGHSDSIFFSPLDMV